MKFIIAVLLSFASGAHAEDALTVALRQLRTHVTFVDLSPEGRAFDRGVERMGSGAETAWFGIFGNDGLPVAVQVVSIGWGLYGAVELGLGGVQFVTAGLTKLLTPRADFVVLNPREYMSAAGLNQFMKLKPRAQYAVASRAPELAAYLIRVNAAYNLAKEYKLVPSE